MRRTALPLRRLTGATLAVFLAGCTSTPTSPQSRPLPLADVPPIVFVHGIHDTHTKWTSMVERVLAEGAPKVASIDYVPNDGSVSLIVSSQQLSTFVDDLLAETGAERIDVVAFSLGTQVVRHWLIRGGGKAKTRRFVAISGPFHGTTWAHLTTNPIGNELESGSAFLTDLEQVPYAPVEVTSIYTPLDTVIVPPESSVIDEAVANISIPVAVHPGMYEDDRVHDAVVAALAAKETP